MEAAFGATSIWQMPSSRRAVRDLHPPATAAALVCVCPALRLPAQGWFRLSLHACITHLAVPPAGRVMLRALRPPATCGVQASSQDRPLLRPRSPRVPAQVCTPRTQTPCLSPSTGRRVSVLTSGSGWKRGTFRSDQPDPFARFPALVSSTRMSLGFKEASEIGDHGRLAPRGLWSQLQLAARPLEAVSKACRAPGTQRRARRFHS